MYCYVNKLRFVTVTPFLSIILAGFEQHAVRVNPTPLVSLYNNHFVLRITQDNPYGFIHD